MSTEADTAAPALSSLLERIDSLRDQIDECAKSLDPATEGAVALTASIAHDLRGILTAIHGYSAAALRRPDDSTLARNALSACNLAAARAAEMTAALGQLGAAAPAGPRSGCRVGTACHQATSIVLGSQPNLHTEYNANITDGDRVCMDECSLVRVFQNLLLNAAEAAQGRPCRVVVRAERVEGRGWVRVSVSDNGPGMDPGVAARVFRAATVGGRGLGLWICRSLVEAAGGCIAVDTAPGEGTTFTILLPDAGGQARAG